MRWLDLGGGVAVVSGAASGIGRATALAFARRGCAVALVDRDAEGLATAAAEVRALGVAASEHVLDVADGAALAALPASVEAALGPATVLVTAAGVSLVGRFEAVSMDEVRWLVEINLFGTVGMVKAFLPQMQCAAAAQIVTVSSLFGIVAPAEQAAYAASKFAVRGFSEALRHEMEGTGVGVTVVHPGGVATAIARSARIAAAADADTEARKSARFDRVFLKTPPAVVGEAIARAVERRAARLVVAEGARAGAWLQRLMPVGYWRVLRRGFARVAGA